MKQLMIDDSHRQHAFIMLADHKLGPISENSAL